MVIGADSLSAVLTSSPHASQHIREVSEDRIKEVLEHVLELLEQGDTLCGVPSMGESGINSMDKKYLFNAQFHNSEVDEHTFANPMMKLRERQIGEFQERLAIALLEQGFHWKLAFKQTGHHPHHLAGTLCVNLFCAEGIAAESFPESSEAYDAFCAQELPPLRPQH